MGQQPTALAKTVSRCSSLRAELLAPVLGKIVCFAVQGVGYVLKLSADFGGVFRSSRSSVAAMRRNMIA